VRRREVTHRIFYPLKHVSTSSAGIPLASPASHALRYVVVCTLPQRSTELLRSCHIVLPTAQVFVKTKSWVAHGSPVIFIKKGDPSFRVFPRDVLSYLWPQ